MMPFCASPSSAKLCRWRLVRTKCEVFSASRIATDETLQLVLTALNSSKSAYASFSLDKNVFFEKYNFSPILTRGKQATDDIESRFTCQLYNKVIGNIPNVLV